MFMYYAEVVAHSSHQLAALTRDIRSCNARTVVIWMLHLKEKLAQEHVASQCCIALDSQIATHLFPKLTGSVGFVCTGRSVGSLEEVWVFVCIRGRVGYLGISGNVDYVCIRGSVGYECITGGMGHSCLRRV